MAWTYEQLITEMTDQHVLAQGELWQARKDYDTAYVQWNAADDHGAIEYCLKAIFHNNQAVEHALWGDYYGYNGATNIIPTALALLSPCEPTDPYVLTMSDILTAMNDAEPHQPLLFMAYVQAYEASVWNASFDEVFFADLVKKWQIWG